MPAFTYDYLVDEFGDFVLDELGNKIIIEVNRIGTTEATRRVARKPRAGYVRSFDVKRNSDDDTWHLTVNKTEYVGRYQTRDEAVSVLGQYGLRDLKILIDKNLYTLAGLM